MVTLNDKNGKDGSQTSPSGQPDKAASNQITAHMTSLWAGHVICMLSMKQKILIWLASWVIAVPTGLSQYMQWPVPAISIAHL